VEGRRYGQGVVGGGFMVKKRFMRTLQNSSKFSARSLKEQNPAVLDVADFANRFIQTSLVGIGWKSKVVLKRVTFSISINKLVAEGCCLEKGQEVYSYLAEDEDKRQIMVSYLDGKRRKK